MYRSVLYRFLEVSFGATKVACSATLVLKDIVLEPPTQGDVPQFDWPTSCSRLLKAELAREEVTLAKLARRLAKFGLSETEATLKNKLYRGTFTMVFFAQCMRALGRDTVDLASVLPPEMPRGKELDIPGDDRRAPH